MKELTVFYRLVVLFNIFVIFLLFSEPVQAVSDADKANGLIQQGWFLENQGKRQEALLLYDQALQIDPNDFLVHKQLGIHWAMEGNYAQGISELNKAVTLNSLDASSFYNLGLVYQNDREYQNAVASYTQAIDLNPNYYAAIYNRGHVYLDLKNYKEAKNDFSRCLIINPKSHEARMSQWLANLGPVIGQFQPGKRGAMDGLFLVLFIFFLLINFIRGRYNLKSPITSQPLTVEQQARNRNIFQIGTIIGLSIIFIYVIMICGKGLNNPANVKKILILLGMAAWIIFLWRITKKD